MRISDWSSDVCSSDLSRRLRQEPLQRNEFTVLFSLSIATYELIIRFGCIAALQITDDRDGHGTPRSRNHRSEEHTSELQSLMRISYAVFCLKTKKNNTIRR